MVFACASVRRQDLHDSSSDDDELDRDADSAIRARLNERLSGMFSLDLGTDPSKNPANQDVGDADDDQPEDSASVGQPAAAEEAFEFRLFSTGGAARVVLEPEDDRLGGGREGGITSERSLSFYVRGELSLEEHARFQNTAVGYDDVLRAAAQRAWGLELPWKVTHIAVKPRKGAGASVEIRVGKGNPQQTSEDSGKRKRPGKKRRVALRMKEKAKKENEEARRQREEAMGKSKLDKEEHMKEKKKRLNRERKLKRRQKEREKKLAKTEAEDEGGVSMVDSDGTD